MRPCDCHHRRTPRLVLASSKLWCLRLRLHPIFSCPGPLPARRAGRAAGAPRLRAGERATEMRSSCALFRSRAIAVRTQRGRRARLRQREDEWQMADAQSRAGPKQPNPKSTSSNSSVCTAASRSRSTTRCARSTAHAHHAHHANTLAAERRSAATHSVAAPATELFEEGTFYTFCGWAASGQRSTLASATERLTRDEHSFRLRRLWAGARNPGAQACGHHGSPRQWGLYTTSE